MGTEWATPLRTRADRTPDRLALIDHDADRRWDFGALDAHVDAVAAGLLAADCSPGDTVASVLSGGPLAAVLPFATLRVGVRYAPLHADADAATLTDQCDRLGADLVVCEAATEAVADDAADAPVASVDDPERQDVAAFAPAAQAGGLETTPLSPDETALVVFTSGTTGRPKGVRLSMGNLLGSARASAARLGVAPRDRWLSPLPPYHVGGLAPLVRTTLSGTTTVLQRSFDPEGTAAAIERRRVTGVSMVPTMLSRLVDAGWTPPERLRFVLLGGGPIPDVLLERALAAELPVCPTYGTTETASQIATATPSQARRAPGTVGEPLSGTSVRVLDEQEEGTPVGEVGDLVVAGPTVAQGYLDPAADDAFREGGVHTGDRGRFDAEGRLWIAGRSDDVIVTGGENVRPSAVEDALLSHPTVDAAAVVGVPDTKWGERVAALVVAADVTPAALRDHCRGLVPDHAVPKTVKIAAELPRTPSGTVDREAVRRRLA